MARWGWLCKSARLLPARTVSPASKDILDLTEISITSVLLLHLTFALLSSVLFFFLLCFFLLPHCCTSTLAKCASMDVCVTNRVWWYCAWELTVAATCWGFCLLVCFTHLSAFIIALTVHVSPSPKVLSVLDGQLTIRNRVIWTRNYTVSSGLITAIIWTRAHKSVVSYLTAYTLGSSRRGPSAHGSKHNPIMCVLHRGKTWIHIWR